MRPSTSAVAESTKPPAFPTSSSSPSPSPIVVADALNNSISISSSSSKPLVLRETPRKTLRPTLDLKAVRRSTMRVKTQPSDHAAVPRTSFSTSEGAAAAAVQPGGTNLGRTTRFSAPNASAVVSTTAAALHPGGRDSLVADLYWTFHGENANKFSDVTLVSSDDKHFPVCRGILAARSAYFAKLLYPDRSRHAPVVGVALPSAVLEVVLHYLHTGDIPASPIADRTALDKLLAVARAAHDMHHEPMLADIVRNILVMVDMNLAMLCPVLEAFCGQVPFGDDEQVLNTLLAHVRANPAAALVLPDFSADDPKLPIQGSPAIKKTGVLELSRRALETLVIKDKREAGVERVPDEYWFYVVWYWAVHASKPESAVKSNVGTAIVPHMLTNGSDVGNDGATISASPESSDLKGETDARRMHATAIIDLLDPSRMRAEFLLRIVEPTMLMSLHKLCEGYKSHATRNLRSVDTSRKRVRFFNRLDKR